MEWKSIATNSAAYNANRLEVKYQFKIILLEKEINMSSSLTHAIEKKMYTLKLREKMMNSLI